MHKQQFILPPPVFDKQAAFVNPMFWRNAFVRALGIPHTAGAVTHFGRAAKRLFGAQVKPLYDPIRNISYSKTFGADVANAFGSIGKGMFTTLPGFYLTWNKIPELLSGNAEEKVERELKGLKWGLGGAAVGTALTSMVKPDYAPLGGLLAGAAGYWGGASQ